MTLVHDLQRKAHEKDIPVSDLLRMAYVVAFF